MASRLKEIVKMYGKVALGVHFFVSGVSISRFYIAIKNNASKQLAKSAGGALALSLLCHKGPFPIMVHITTTQAPLIARFLRQRKIFKTGG
ncbi:hypothetical protein Bca52824_042327 [Brassica carinata]|uniref:DUF1279 domain-containing protein n=1 Tax=Brassica carinata TaxID=52824 RepID=A0A8X7RUJ7_BRACI|nr:hypothetical protein Bca52824_042327 [Brassica carinata]